MILVDTSIWIEVLRDADKRPALEAALGGDDPVLVRFVQLELLQGGRDESDWERLSPYLESQDYLEMQTQTWTNAARIYFDLRRRGRTVRSPIDCCIAQLAIENDALLLHRDEDFEIIGEVRNLRQRRLRFSTDS